MRDMIELAPVANVMLGKLVELFQNIELDSDTSYVVKTEEDIASIAVCLMHTIITVDNLRANKELMQAFNFTVGLVKDDSAMGRQTREVVMANNPVDALQALINLIKSVDKDGE